MVNATFEKIENKIEKIAFILLSILTADLCIFGAGRMIEFGLLTFRIILLVLLFVACIPLFFRRIKELFKSKYIIAVLGFVVLLVASTIIGYLNGNRINLIITDLKGFAYFAFLPCAMVLINSREKVITLTKICMYSAAVLALVHLIFVCLYVADVPGHNVIANFCEERRFFYISYRISDQNVRVSFLSLVCLLFGTAFSIYFGAKEDTKLSKTLYPVITAVCVLSLFMSYTRSVYLALAVTVLVLVCVFMFRATKKEKITALKNITVAIVVFFLIVGGFYVKTGENYFTYGLSRVFIGIDFSSDQPDISIDEDSDDEADKPAKDELDSFKQNTLISDELRTATVNDLVTNIKKSPIIGLGLGAEIPSRPDGLNEYFFLDLLSKMGALGFGFFIAPIIFMIISLVGLIRSRHSDVLLATGWICVLLGTVAYSYFTPCMNSSVGILVYCLAIGVFEFFKKSSTKKEMSE